ncbi:hypothetical protein [Paraliomyxa miuraensis]|uniref:hypothetical protein n=1 Tax=Paraliomyxa miuraensis TaxID=376150 RepID=UPI00224DF18A|nr:hypothetical protein [Paraliomyxa miuraensis]MCX4247731.1 hypothetical protein [Paraliomyxa miuraensis]
MNERVTEGLEQAVEALCRRGIEAGEREANALVAQARAEAAELRDQARAEAERIVEDARRRAEQQRTQLDRELRQAAAAGVLMLRQAVEQAVLGATLHEVLEHALGDGPTLEALLVEAARAFAASGHGDAELEVLLSPQVAERLGAALMARVGPVARRGVRLRPEGGPSGGFVLAADGVQLDFSHEAFTQVLMRFLAPRFRQYLGTRSREVA